MQHVETVRSSWHLTNCLPDYVPVPLLHVLLWNFVRQGTYLSILVCFELGQCGFTIFWEFTHLKIIYQELIIPIFAEKLKIVYSH